MKALMKIACAAAFAIGLAAPSQAQGAKAHKAPAKPAVKKEPVFWAAGDIKWVDVPEMKGTQQAVLWGNPKMGAYGSLDKWPGGTETPVHTHTLAIKAVILAGTLVITPDGGAAKELPAGSYVMIPGGMKHATTCKAGADCVFFGEQAGKFDMKPAAPPTKK